MKSTIVQSNPAFLAVGLTVNLQRNTRVSLSLNKLQGSSISARPSIESIVGFRWIEMHCLGDF